MGPRIRGADGSHDRDTSGAAGMNNAARSIRMQEARMAEVREQWADMARLFERGDLAGFWRAYADYLEGENVISGYRKLLHSAARATADALPNRQPPLAASHGSPPWHSPNSSP